MFCDYQLAMIILRLYSMGGCGGHILTADNNTVSYCLLSIKYERRLKITGHESKFVHTSKWPPMHAHML